LSESDATEAMQAADSRFITTLGVAHRLCRVDGADFGGGFWDILASRSNCDQGDLTELSIGPMNNVSMVEAADDMGSLCTERAVAQAFDSRR
jgi:hypothetical protein